MDTVASLGRRDRRVPLGALLLLVTAIAQFFLEIGETFLFNFAYVHREITWMDTFRTSIISLFSLRSFLPLFLLFVGKVLLIVFCVLLLTKARKTLLTTGFTLLGLCFSATALLSLLLYLVAIWGAVKNDGLSFLEGEVAYYLYLAFPLIFALFFLALVSAGEIGKRGENFLAKAKDVFAGLAFLSLGVYAFFSIFFRVYQLLFRLRNIPSSFYEPGSVTNLLVPAGVVFLYYAAVLFVAVLELFGWFSVARWVLSPYKKAVRQRLDTGLRFPVGAVLLPLSALIPIYASMLQWYYTGGGHIFELSFVSFLGNVAILVSLVLSVILLLKRRRILLTSALGLKCLAAATLPSLAWVVSLVGMLVRGEAISAFAIGKSLLSLLSGALLVLAILALTLVAASEIGKNGKNFLLRFKKVFVGLAIALLALFSLVLALPALYNACGSLFLCVKFLLSPIMDDGISFQAIQTVLFRLPDAVIAAAAPFFFKLLAVTVKLIAWWTIALWVISPVKKSKKEAEALSETVTETDVAESAAAEDAAPFDTPAASPVPEDVFEPEAVRLD